MKQLIHIPQGESHLIGGQWFNQGDHEIDVPDPLEGLNQPEEAANLDLPPGDASSAPAPARRGKKAADAATEPTPETSSDTKE